MLGSIALGRILERVVGFVGIRPVKIVLGVDVWGRAWEEEGSRIFVFGVFAVKWCL